MEYTVKQLADLAGVSSRTLRYYDSIGLLKPQRLTDAGYRIYTEDEVDRLQQILFYKALDFDLEQIAEMLSDPSYDALTALKQQKACLLKKRSVLDQMIDNITKTIVVKEGNGTMSDQEKFKGLIEQKIQENEQTYGEEIRTRFGDATIEQSYGALRKMSEADYEAFVTLEKEIIKQLKVVDSIGDPSDEAGKNLASMHRQWISMAWGKYDQKAHLGLIQMYVLDERFKAYFDDRAGEGAAAMIRDCVCHWIG